MYIDDLRTKIKQLEESDYNSFEQHAYNYRHLNLEQKQLKRAHFNTQIKDFVDNKTSAISFHNFDACIRGLEELNVINSKKKTEQQKETLKRELEEAKDEKYKEEKRKELEKFQKKIKNIEFEEDTWQQIIHKIIMSRNHNLPPEFVDLKLTSTNKKKLLNIIQETLQACVGKDEDDTNKRIEWMEIYTSNFLRSNADEDY